jgi:hypothetical protein
MPTKFALNQPPSGFFTKMRKEFKDNGQYADKSAEDIDKIISGIFHNMSDSQKENIVHEHEGSANPPAVWWYDKFHALKNENPALSESEVYIAVANSWNELENKNQIIMARSAELRLNADHEKVAAEFRNLFSTNYAKWIQMEVKLLAMNNFGRWESMADANENVNKAIDEVAKLLQKAVKVEITRLVEEVRYDILDEMSATVKEEQIGLSAPQTPVRQNTPGAPATNPVAPAASIDISLNKNAQKILASLCFGEEDILSDLVKRTSSGEIVPVSLEEIKAAHEAVVELRAFLKPGAKLEQIKELEEFLASKLTKQEN